MKYSKLIIPILVVGVIVLIGVSWWGSREPVDEEVSSPEENLAEEGIPASSLTEILATAKDLPSYAFDMVADYLGEETISRLWVKDGSTKMETTSEAGTTVYLMQAETQSAYLYFPEKKTGMQLEWDDTAQTTSGGMFGDEYIAEIQANQPIIVGEEMLDGKNCLVTQWTAEGMEEKVWIWKEYGLPIRTEITMGGETNVTEFRNIQIGNVADSEFELPDDIQITPLP